MKGIVEDRVIIISNYIIATKSTVRGTAKEFGIGKSTVFTDATVRLKKLNPQLYIKVQEVLGFNKEQRSIRGGMATKKKRQLNAAFFKRAS